MSCEYEDGPFQGITHDYIEKKPFRLNGKVWFPIQCKNCGESDLGWKLEGNLNQRDKQLLEDDSLEMYKV